MPRRRWLQFSLRGFLVVLTIACLWSGWHVDRAMKQRHAVDVIQRAGGTVCYGSDPDHPEVEVDPDTDHYWLDYRLPVTIAFIPDCEHGAELFQAIEALAELRTLDLDGTHVTDRDVARLASLRQLDCLTLTYTDITDEHLKHIAKMKNLVLLDLRGTSVSYQGAMHLVASTTLCELDVSDTRVRRYEGDKLRDAMPACDIFVTRDEWDDFLRSGPKPLGRRKGERRLPPDLAM